MHQIVKEWTVASGLPYRVTPKVGRDSFAHATRLLSLDYKEVFEEMGDRYGVWRKSYDNQAISVTNRNF